MNNKIKVAILGSTGYVGLELIRILINHPNVNIEFLGCDNLKKSKKFNLNSNKNNIKLPKLSLNKEFKPNTCDVVFLALPHGISQNFVKSLFNKIKIIDLSADFRLDDNKIYKKNYDQDHLCPNLLNKFNYGLFEIYKKDINNFCNIAVPGCYPTSILLPLIPLIKNNLIFNENIIIDSKSGYSGAGKNFDLKNIKKDEHYNFYNYNTNHHRHICEIQQELNKFSNSKKIKFSFNPHILPIYRGMMSTLYCDLNKNVDKNNIQETLINFYQDSPFINIITNETRADFNLIQNTNNCIIKIFEHNSTNKIIIVSLIDNLLKGAAGQAIQCFNKIFEFDEKVSLINIK